MADIRVAFWNLENLFDRAGDPQRDPVLATRLANELVGWTAAVRNTKLDQLASIIVQMFGGVGPDVLGVCEVENENVLQLLINRLGALNRNYQVLAHPSPDARGIDVSFIFDAATLTNTEAEHQVVVKRSATRDIFRARFTENATGEQFDMIANHWPSRSGGQYASEPFRMITGETLSFVLSDLLEPDRNRPVLLTGDFNDEPFNRSMQEYLLGSRDRDRVMNATTPRALNLMWPLMFGGNPGDDPGTYKFGSDWNMLDQFLATRGLLLTTSPLQLVPGSAAIFKPAVLVGAGGAARKYGRPSKASSFDQGGFSDHFPITCVLRS